MKKIISVFMAVVLFVISATLITSASENPVVIITTEDAEYTIEFENTNLSEEKRQTIANNLVFGKENDIQTYGLMCSLFGHKTEENTVLVVSHKYKAISPRCKRDSYLVTTCTRCDYQEQELYASIYIVCCPED